MIGHGSDTVIAIHGGPGVDLESIAGDFVPLAEHHVVIFYDQRGTGRSTLPADTTRLGADQQIADLDAVRQYFGLARVTLVAHSYGPLLAATYALAHPDAVRRMVFFGPVPPRRGDFWTRFGKTMASRLDSTQQARSRRREPPARRFVGRCAPGMPRPVGDRACGRASPNRIARSRSSARTSAPPIRPASGTA